MISAAKRMLRSIAFYLPNRLHGLRRERELKSSRTEISRPQLVADLSRLPIERGAIVLVHSSLKSLGFVSGGAPTVVEALVEAFVKRNGGTVMLPCYSINGTMHQTLLEQRIFDVSKTPSNLGAIPEAFRKLPGAVRSIHPTHSFAAIGPDAEWLTGTHHSCGTSFGAGSPMAKLREKQSYLLGLGTNLGTVTFYHCLEDIEADFPLAVHTADSPLTVTCRGYSGEAHSLSLKAFDGAVARTRIDRPENAAIREFFTHRFERYAGLRWFQIGEARSWLISASALYDEARNLMKNGVTIYSTSEEIEAFKRVRGEE